MLNAALLTLKSGKAVFTVEKFNGKKSDADVPVPGREAFESRLLDGWKRKNSPVAEFVFERLASGVSARAPVTLDGIFNKVERLLTDQFARSKRREVEEFVESLKDRKLAWQTPSGELIPTYIPSDGLEHPCEPFASFPKEAIAASSEEDRKGYASAFLCACYCLGAHLYVPKKSPGKEFADEYSERFRAGANAQLDEIKASGALSEEDMRDARAILAIVTEIHRCNLSKEHIWYQKLVERLANDYWGKDCAHVVSHLVSSLELDWYSLYAEYGETENGRAGRLLFTDAFHSRFK